MLWLAVALGTIGTMLSLAMTIPQGVVIWRDRSLEGVSVTAWAVLILTLSLWLGFAWRTGNVTMVVGNLVALGVCFWIAAGGVRARGYRPAWVWGTILVIAVEVSVAVLVGYLARGLLIDLLLPATALTWLPQVFRSARTAIAGSASEVSRASLAMGIAANLAWTLHGVVLPDVMIAIASFVQVVVIACVLLLEVVAGRRRERRGTTPTAGPHGRAGEIKEDAA